MIEDSPVSSVQRLTPWTDIIRNEFPDFEIEDIGSFTPFIRQFLKVVYFFLKIRRIKLAHRIHDHQMEINV